MLRPFHYAFLVLDLDATRRFYGDLLGCREGRSSDTWVDFDLFGNQLSAHVAPAIPEPAGVGHVDGIEVPVPHFGAILTWDEFDRVARALQDADVPFLISPRVRYPGQPGEQATLFVRDPSGNPIELKAFRYPAHVFTE